MDIISVYIEENDELSASSFFQHEESAVIIESADYDLSSKDELKKKWKDLLNEYIGGNEGVKIKRDFFRVNWEDLWIKVATLKQNQRLQEAAQQQYSAAVNRVVNTRMSTVLVDAAPCLGSTLIANKITAAKSALQYQPDLSKQDLLYYNIMDFVSKKETGGMQKAMTKDEFKYFLNHFTVREAENEAVKNYAEGFFHESSKPLKEVLKEEKSKVRLSEEPKQIRKFKKQLIKAAKLINEVLRNQDLPIAALNEDMYLHSYIHPLIKVITRDLDFLLLITGESYLKAKAAEENAALGDDGRRRQGSKIDIVFKSKSTGYEISMLEISGPPNKTNQKHYLEDRNKLGKNLKCLHKAIINNLDVFDLDLISKLKVYGFHIYENQLRVYSIQRPIDSYYVYIQEKLINIPYTYTTIPKLVPKFLSQLYSINEYITNTENTIQSYINSRNDSDVESTDSRTSAPYMSPKN